MTCGFPSWAIGAAYSLDMQPLGHGINFERWFMHAGHRWAGGPLAGSNVAACSACQTPIMLKGGRERCRYVALRRVVSLIRSRHPVPPRPHRSRRLPGCVSSRPTQQRALFVPCVRLGRGRPARSFAPSMCKAAVCPKRRFSSPLTPTYNQGPKAWCGVACSVRAASLLTDVAGRRMQGVIIYKMRVRIWCTACLQSAAQTARRGISGPGVMAGQAGAAPPPAARKEQACSLPRPARQHALWSNLGAAGRGMRAQEFLVLSSLPCAGRPQAPCSSSSSSSSSSSACPRVRGGPECCGRQREGAHVREPLPRL